MSAAVLAVNIAATCVEGALFGIFLALALSAISLLVNRRWNEVNAHTVPPVGWLVAVRGVWRSTLFGAAVLFILTITVHWCLGVRRTFDAFQYYDGGTEPGDYFADLRNPLEVARTALLIVTLLIGDLILVHRTWIIWNRSRWVAVAPSISSAGLFASGIGVIRQFAVNSPTDGVFVKNVTDWIIAVVATTLFTKLYGTAMIAARIHIVDKKLKRSKLKKGGRGALEILMISIESSLLSTAWAVFFAIAYASKSALQAFPTACYPAISGIAAMLIALRIGLGWDLQLGVVLPASDSHPSSAHPGSATTAAGAGSPGIATLAPFRAYRPRAARRTGALGRAGCANLNLSLGLGLGRGARETRDMEFVIPGDVETELSPPLTPPKDRLRPSLRAHGRRVSDVLDIRLDGPTGPVAVPVLPAPVRRRDEGNKCEGSDDEYAKGGYS